MSAEEDRSNRSNYVENDQVSLGAASSITIHTGTGGDTGTDRYLNMPEARAYGIEIIPTVACSITQINGRDLKAAISIGTGGYISNNLKWESVKILAGSATVVEISGKGGC